MEKAGDLNCFGLNRPPATTIGGSLRLSVYNVPGPSITIMLNPDTTTILLTKFIIPSIRIKTKEIILIDHLNLCLISQLDWQKIACTYPTVAFKLRNATGNTVPPIDDAKDIIPNAVSRLLLNQWEMILVIGPYITPHETYERQQLEAGNYWRREVEH